MATSLPHVEAPNLSPLPGIRHGFFGRQGGVSTGLYSSLNVGTGSNDAPGDVSANRERVRAAMQADALLSCYQTHSADVVHVTEAWDARPEADAMVTTEQGIGLCILTADCTPVLFADAQARIIGAAHAGWKGAIGGVLDATVAAMTLLGAEAGRITAAIGPTIQQASYEVGPEFRETFLAQSPGSAALFTQGHGDRYHFDLPGFCHQRLKKLGLKDIHNTGLDTCALEDRYFSNRRRNHHGEPDYGRNGSVIMLEV
ncbi:peptidoglycan editing factor PgeF [Hyphomonas pacifica]|uniref:peptidoglycan editing factor PgeF n=1 Tax=Hyphomonas pacifica TaxID=1280941 RepID=UPI000DBF8E52|nr:peptidoglycan editing factor PgeF [Hyphomonas pacifica]RAN37457.1 hypothetical protein HY11_09265 [Hyphomonas pacifica]